MTKKLNSRGFGAVEAVLIIVIVGIIAGVGYFIYDAQKLPNADVNSQPVTLQNKDKTAELTLDTQKLPEGWTVQAQELNNIMVENKSNGCFTNVSYSTDTAESNSAEVNHKQQTIDGIKAKGYSVEELQAEKLTVNTTQGTEAIEALSIKVNSPDNIVMFQNYGYITKEKSYVYIQISCPNQSDMQSAQSVLKAITIKG